MQRRLEALYPDAKISTLGAHTLLIGAANSELQQIQTLISAIDAPPPTATPLPAPTPPETSAVHLFQAPARTVAREVANAVHGLRVSVAGQALVLAGSADLIAKAKDLIAILDVPAARQRYTSVYRIRTLDAQSIGDLIQRSFPDAKVTVDEDINSISVLATSSEQERISDAIARLDAQNGPAENGAGPGSTVAPADGPGSVQIYTMKAALPSTSGGTSTSATDLATLVTQALQQQAPDLHISVSPDAPQMVLTGSPYSIKVAKDLLTRLDVPQPLVVLDTEILEMDENTAKNLGIQLSSINGGPLGIGTVYTEESPPPDPITGIAPPLRRFQPLYRTPISFGVAVNLAIQHGQARVLADPRITTLSGHTASIRAGDNISIPLTTGGGVGTIATTQIQTFQTGVTLDITPVVNAGGTISVALHPVVNSLTSILNGVPQISTRDTQTIVDLKEDQTLVIGGLIQDDTQRSDSKIPVLGDLPLLGPLFRNQTINGDSNELIISVTPHIVNPNGPNVYPGPPLPRIPKPVALPTLPPGTVLPASAPTPMPMTNAQAPSAPAPTEAISSPAPTPMQPAPPPPPEPNTYTYGAVPNSNIATATDPPTIYYATISPTLLSHGTPMQFSAITSTNVARLALGYNGVSMSLSQTSAGSWHGTFPFAFVTAPGATGPITLTLVADKADGTSASIPIPLTVMAQAASGRSQAPAQRAQTQPPIP
ncbi:MAG TPA: hypothetical protein VKT72_01085 [Candidatus Baltobacteraceae bacterium]|nr:hypothetical protein [Candidatus Baltobacteraceae bacterium]